jgi:hypothetical protein
MDRGRGSGFTVAGDLRQGTSNSCSVPIVYVCLHGLHTQLGLN